MSKTCTEDQQKKGKAAENEMRLWLDRNGFAHVAVCQTKQTFAALFSGTAKRPDFLVRIDGIGVIAVDVKHREPIQNGKIYTLELDDDLDLALMFERSFRWPVWYVFRGPESSQWFWITAVNAALLGKKARNEHGNFLRIELADFVCIRSGADFGKLFTQRPPRLKRRRDHAPQEPARPSGMVS